LHAEQVLFMRPLQCWSIAALAILLSAYPERGAATVLYEYRATCESACGAIGLSPGDAVGGLIGVSDESATLGVVLSPADVELFDFHFGSFAFDLSSLGYAFAVFTGVEREAFTFLFITNADGGSPGFAFGETSWIAGASVAEAAAGGPGTLRRLVAPEPGPAALVGAGLIAWSLRGWRARGAARA
jgi:hypothetical protein